MFWKVLWKVSVQSNGLEENKSKGARARL